MQHHHKVNDKQAEKNRQSTKQNQGQRQRIDNEIAIFMKPVVPRRGEDMAAVIVCPYSINGKEAIAGQNKEHPLK